MRTWPQRIRENARGAVAWVCAAFMLCAVPLLFHNAFFDINRFKVAAVCRVIPCLLAAYLAAWAVRPRGKRQALEAVRAPIVCMAAFLLACVISAARTGFDAAALTGSEGRWCGLYFLLSCGAAFMMIALGRSRLAHIDTMAMLCAGAVAVLGIGNAFSLDPLGFYTTIRPDQMSIFLSTIGNADFFGAYLAMLFPLAGARFVLGERGRAGSFLLAMAIALGVVAARTDSAFLALHLCCAALLACRGGSLRGMARALILWGGCFLALYALWLPLTAADRMLSGLLLALCASHAAPVLGAVCFAGAYICLRMERREIRAPGRRLALVMGVALAVAVLALCGVITYYTCVDTQSELGAAQTLLRFDDDWGSRRGFVYARSLRAYADFSPADKLFGRGVDTAARILGPYMDNPRILARGTFNDAHCQPLQLLLTCGLVGALAYVALYGAVLRALWRGAGDDALLCGLLSSLTGYAVIMLLQVTQPILIATWFSLSALALARITHMKEGDTHEP